jgi:hypothetical protein
MESQGSFHKPKIPPLSLKEIMLAKQVMQEDRKQFSRNTHFVWNHGAAFVESARAAPNEIKHPPINELTNILSILMRAFFAPMRETSSVVCAGVKASITRASILVREIKRV